MRSSPPGLWGRKQTQGCRLELGTSARPQGRAGLTATARSRDQRAGRGRNSCFLPTPPRPDDRESAACHRLGQRPDADPAPQGLGRPPSGSQPGPGAPGPPRQDNESKGALGQSRGLEAAVGTPAQTAGLKATASRPTRRLAPPAPPPGLAPHPFPTRDPGVPRPSTLTPGGGNKASRSVSPFPSQARPTRAPRLPPDSQPEAAREGNGQDVGWGPQGRRRTSRASACVWTVDTEEGPPASRPHEGSPRPVPSPATCTCPPEGIRPQMLTVFIIITYL